MATCKKCIYYEKCLSRICHGMGIDVNDKPSQDMEVRCRDFKDSSKFIEVPCKIGDTAWAIRTCGKTKKVKSGIVDGLGISKDMQVIVNIKHIGCGIWGQKIFPTEEAVLKAMEKGGGNNA
ncbi:MAG: hypothetical protein IKB62_04210 [Oscillospiraceae bacterium]|nr:hypothetical protein [Oscillospiraceae bacterium]